MRKEIVHKGFQRASICYFNRLVCVREIHHKSWFVAASLKPMADASTVKSGHLEENNPLSKPSDVELILETGSTKAKDVQIVNGSVLYTGEEVASNGEVYSGTEKETHKQANGLEEHRTGHHNGGASPKSELGGVKLAPAESTWTIQADGAVNLRMGSSEATSRVPMTVVEGLQRAVRLAPNRVALAVKRNGEWMKWSYQEYYKSVCTAAKALIKVCDIKLTSSAFRCINIKISEGWTRWCFAVVLGATFQIENVKIRL